MDKEEKKEDDDPYALTDTEQALLQALRKGRSTLAGVAEELNIPKEKAFDVLDLRKSIYDKTGYIIEFNKGARKITLKREAVSDEVVEFPKIASGTVKILFISDLGMGLKVEQGDLIKTVFEEVKKQGSEIYFGVIAGNLCAGKPSKKDMNDYFIYDYDKQLKRLIKFLPKASFNQYVANSWRDLRHPEPETMGEALAGQREDIRCLGNYNMVFLVNDTLIMVSHIGADCSAYTLSHTMQVVEERYQDATNYVYMKENKPKILMIGGVNADFEITPEFPLSPDRENNFYTQAIPSLVPATDYQLSKRGRRALPFEIGYVILSLEFDKHGHLVGEPKFDVRRLTAYIKKDNYLAEAKLIDNLDEEEKKIITILNEKNCSKGLLSNTIGKSTEHAEEVVAGLRSKGYNIIYLATESRFKIEKQLKEKFEPVEIESVKSAKFALISDTHIGDKNERPDLLKKAYEIAEKAKATIMLHCGDVFEGADAHPFHSWELEYILADEQRDHGLAIWPRSKIPTYIIRGSTGHETKFLDIGYDIVDTFCQLGRCRYHKKLYYLGGMNGTVDINGIECQLLHPRGGLPRGKSYRMQILIENMVKTIEKYSRKKVFTSGHLHVATAMNYKGIFSVMSPCLEDTTDYLIAGGHTVSLGMWVCEVFMDEYNNVIRTIREYFPFLPRCEEHKKIKKIAKVNKKK